MTEIFKKTTVCGAKPYVIMLHLWSRNETSHENYPYQAGFQGRTNFRSGMEQLALDCLVLSYQ